MLYSKAKTLAETGKKPIDIAEDLGISVRYAPFETIAGMSIQAGEKRFILINSTLSDLERQFVCGHELGHFFLHPSTNFVFILQKTLFYIKEEYQANMFSCHLMLGEKAEEYRPIVSEACSAESLEKILRIIATFLEVED
jgi:Zn-dependent peptidase ImmA (M78 family)